MKNKMVIFGGFIGEKGGWFITGECNAKPFRFRWCQPLFQWVDANAEIGCRDFSPAETASIRRKCNAYDKVQNFKKEGGKQWINKIVK